MRISDWSSDVCSSDLQYWQNQLRAREDHLPSQERYSPRVCGYCTEPTMKREGRRVRKQGEIIGRTLTTLSLLTNLSLLLFFRSEEHTSELQSLMRISYAVFCLKKKNKYNKNYYNTTKRYTMTR